VKIITDCAIFFEFTNENLLNSDLAIEVMEQIAAELQLLNDSERLEIVRLFHEISEEYERDM
jgi:hypothetical protein